MSRRALALLLALLTTAAAQSDDTGPRYRFLVALPLGGHSPSMDTLAVAVALAQRGHHITAVVPQDDMPFSTRAAARHGDGTGADLIEWLPYDCPFSVGSDTAKEMASRVFKGNRFAILTALQKIFTGPCETLMGNTTLLQTLTASRFDALLTFAMPGDTQDNCACVMAHYLGLPIVSVNGVPFITAPWGVPQFGSGVNEADLLTLRGRAINALYYAATRTMDTVLRFVSARAMKPIRRRLALPLGPPHTGASCRTMLQLCANSFLYEAPRPIGPPQVLIGPIAPRAARGPPDPPHVAEFVAAAPDGFAVVSFGSVPHIFSSIGREEFTELAEAFAAAKTPSGRPLSIVWLMQRKRLPEGLTVDQLPIGNNTIVVDWVDINDLLGQPNCRLFVTHGGCHSSYEALFHGVPIIGVPFQFEQLANAHRLAALGLGVVSRESLAARKRGASGEKHGYTREGMGGLIKQVLSDSSYTDTARRIGASAKHLAAIRPALKLAVEEIELAMGHQGYGTWRPHPKHVVAATSAGGGGVEGDEAGGRHTAGCNNQGSHQSHDGSEL